MKGITAFLTFLFIIPIGHILTGMAIKFSAAGQITVILIALSIAIIIMYATKYIASEVWETFCGLIAGVLLWASLFEMGFRLLVKTFNLDETKSIELTLVLIVPLSLYLFFNENIKCTFFLNLRKLFHPEKQTPNDIQIDRWCPRTAVKVFFIMWFGHVALYYTYDETIFGETGYFTKFFFAFCFFAGSYLIYRLLKAKEMGFAFRYTIPTVVIIWSCVETIGRWRNYPDPMAMVDSFFIMCIVISLALLTFIIIRSEKKKKAVTPS
jgi:hypothetical protein